MKYLRISAHRLINTCNAKSTIKGCKKSTLANSNFIDHVKIYLRSGNGGRVLYISEGRSTCQKADLTEETVDEVVTL